MRISRFLIFYLFLVAAGAVFQPLYAQLGFKLKVDKPDPYQDRVLKAEKTGDKPLKAHKRFFQNLTTHYNYYFNANNKLNEVIERAKQSHIDDYAQLLPFYNYSLDITAQDKVQLDSVIYKSQTAIVMHDLRNDWIDNMYMLWGASFYFLKEFDSASLMFQFINHSFAEKQADGYYKYIGSRMDGNNALSISTKEDPNFFQRAFSESPSRNEAFIWQIRSLIEKKEFTYAGSLIETLKNDPLFPERLHDDLEEVQAYWFYKQNLWDSAATHLLNALSVAETSQETARWEYLVAQLFEKTGHPERSIELYERARKHTTDPVLDVYARLNLVRLNQNEEGVMIDKNVEDLVKMAKRSKYEDYRDVIYYMAAQMEMERKNFPKAKEYLLKATQNDRGNLSSRNNSFLQIADIAYDEKEYFLAASYYDSVQTTDLTELQVKRVNERKAGLAKVLVLKEILARQDSLQRIAALPEEERDDYINDLVKRLRKQQGLEDDNQALSSGRAPSPTAANNLFNEQQGKGEWYFYNNTIKTQGQVQFQQTWGNRPNSDNWRRFAVVSNQLAGRLNAPDPGPPGTARLGGNPNVTDDLEGPTYNSLLAKLPLDEAGRRMSDDSVMHATFDLGVVFMNDLEDYPSAIEAFERLLSTYSSFEKQDEALFHLYYAYTKMGDFGKAEQVKNQLAQFHASSRFNAIITTGKDPEAQPRINPQATKDYEAVYDMFLEGRFEEARIAKKIADSTYKTNHWQPQLLYIESVYHIKNREDSAAIQLLETIVSQNQAEPLTEKAKTMIDVLRRRAEIENELRNLEIVRPAEDTMITIRELVRTPEPKTIDTLKSDSSLAVVEEPVIEEEEEIVGLRGQRTGSIATNTRKPAVINPVNLNRDSLNVKEMTQLQRPSMHGYTFNPNDQHLVLLVLDKVDIVFSGEALNAFNRFNKERFRNQEIGMEPYEISSEKKLVMIGPFINAQDAVDYMDLVKQLAPGNIIPWLKPEKYSFLILSTENLPVLKDKKDLTLYYQFLQTNLPGKF